MKEFYDSAIGRFCSILDFSSSPFYNIVYRSDGALFGAFKLLKEKYPQVPDSTDIKFPEVKTMKNDCNLLNNFPSKCYSDSGFLNIQTLYSDLKFMIDQSATDFLSFEKDMKELLG